MRGLLLIVIVPAFAQEARHNDALPEMRETRDSRTIEALFTPQDDVVARIVALIGRARHEVLVQSYLFSNRRIGDALVGAHRSGRDVRVINDQQSYEQGSAPVIPVLAAAGIPVQLDALHSAAHNKIIVIDGEEAHPVIVTGSFNFTVAAQKYNAENLLVIRGEHDLAHAYRMNWLQHQTHAVRLQ
jgi:phosphatidylserine/phosphatidylglycerophosphate/cardiolipin synthase-like enzyme